MPDDANFAATLSARARAHPGATALIESGARRTITFGALESLAGRYAHGLARWGVRSGDRALYLLRPSIDSYAVFYALLRLGAVPVLMDPRMGLRRLLTCIAVVRPRVVLAVPLVHAVRVFARQPFAAAQVLITAGRRWFWGGVRLSECLAEDGTLGNPPTAPADASFLPFTSGSTGAAKAVFYDHAMLRQQVAVMHDVCDWREGMRVVMAYAPFVPYALADGLAAILPDIDFSRPAAANPARIVEAVRQYAAQCAFASPIVWIRLARYCERNGIALPTLERAVTAGAPVPADLHRRLLPVLHRDGQLYTPYGATEAMPLTTTCTSELVDTWEETRRGGGTCVGTPLACVEIRIIRVTDDPIPVWADDLCVPEGAIGEIVVGGPLVSPAYPDRPDETARAKIRRGPHVLHRMGDLGRRDATGRLWFCGRKSDRIETRHGLLPSGPLESIFDQHPAVFRSAVVGMGPIHARTVVACVELDAGETFTPRLEAELSALTTGTCYEGVVTRFFPHRGFPVDTRHNSKIRRDELAGWAAARLSRRARS